MFTGSRDETRRYFAQIWRRHCSGAALQPLEILIRDVIAAHPEYHPAVEEGERYHGADDPDVNPFLHMGLHIALLEQLQADRPAGVRAVHQELRAQGLAVHDAEHRMMQMLAEVLGEAQARGLAPDESDYLRRLRRLVA